VPGNLLCLVDLASSCAADPLTTPFCSPTEVFGLAPVAEVAVVAKEGSCDMVVVTAGLVLAVVVRAAGAR